MLTDPQRFTTARPAFPGLEGKFYFNFGGQGILPKVALQAILETYQFLEAEGPFSIAGNRYFQTETEHLRQAIADELGVKTETITITDNVTAGCNIVLWGLDWQVGDHILLTDCEHTGVIAIVKAIAARFGVTYSECPILASLKTSDPEAQVLEIIEQHLTPKTRLVVLSHLLWNTGQLLPLEAIVKTCHNYAGEYPVQVLVDGAQSAGSMPLNFSESAVDYYAFTGHKWFCGPSGVGGLYIKPECFENLLLTYVGWRSLAYSSQGEAIGWQNNGSRFEVATSAFPLFQGLRAAMALHHQFGTGIERSQRINELAGLLWEGLRTMPNISCVLPIAPQSGLVSFQLSDRQRHPALVKELESQRVYLRMIAHPSCIRACCHYFTTEQEINELLELLRKLV
ncbi:MAG: aminotransferase class V-fold PLP-dependent enzyme [Microcystaceae cyanobacterium]